MFAFLEREGGKLLVETIGTWVMYMMYQAKAKAIDRKKVDAKHKNPEWHEVKKRLVNELNFRKKIAMFGVGETIYARQYSRAVEGLGGLAHHLVDQKELARLAQPFYN